MNLIDKCRVAVALCLLASNQPYCYADTVPSTTSPQASGVVDDGVPGWTWSGMVEVGNPEFHGGTSHAGGSGSNCAYTFKGSGVEIYGMTGPTVTVDGHGHKLGSADVLLDGKPVGAIDEKGSAEEIGAVLKQISGLSNENHVLQLKASAGWFVVDYIKVTGRDLADSERVHSKITSLIPEGDYRIIPGSSTNQCLGVVDNGSQDGALLEINTLTAGHERTWHIEPLGREHYRMTLYSAPDQCLCISGENKSPAPQGFLWHNLHDPRQEVILEPRDNGTVSIRLATDPNIVLDVDHGDQGVSQPGTHVICFNWHGGINQVWWLKPAK